MTTKTTVPDGVYGLWPDGSGWELVEIRNGAVAARTEESNAGTHCTAGDQWAAACEAMRDESRQHEVADETAQDVLQAAGHEPGAPVAVVRID